MKEVTGTATSATIVATPQIKVLHVLAAIHALYLMYVHLVAIPSNPQPQLRHEAGTGHEAKGGGVRPRLARYAAAAHPRCASTVFPFVAHTVFPFAAPFSRRSSLITKVLFGS